MSSEFPKFALIVNTSFQALARNKKAFAINLDPPEPTTDEPAAKPKPEYDRKSGEPKPSVIFSAYLAAFPEGTNPLFRVRTEHDCSCCRQFIRRAGIIVVPATGETELKTVWDEAAEKAPYPYNEVAVKMRDLVKAAAIADLYLVGQKEESFGAQESHSKAKDDATVMTWNHFFSGKVPSALRPDKLDTVKGNYRTTVQVFERGLTELKPEAFEVVLSLIEDKNLYRGEESKPALQTFQKAQREFLKKDERSRKIFVWANADSPAARLRGTAMGTLIVDLSEGKELEHAVKAFETIMAPQNYKRTQALVTPAMINKAMETVTELDLEPALERRFARINDISINDVKWSDSAVKALMKGGLHDALLKHATSNLDVEVEAKKAEEVGLEVFMTDILPHCSKIDLLLRNVHLGNLMSLTAPVHPEPRQLFKWKNDFAWAYIGNAADSELRQAVQSRGGSVTGVFRFSHSWNYGKRNTSLMDLHVYLPGSDMHDEPLNGVHNNYGNAQRVNWNHRQHEKSGGVQDVDYVNAAPVGFVPVENITFPDIRRMPEGKYLCKVHNWQHRVPTDAGFRAEIEFGGVIYAYEVERPLKHHEWVAVATVTLKSGAFSIEHHIPCGSAPQEKWGLKTEQYVKVNAVTLSPNYWGDNTVGNKHTFFLLDGARNDEPTRGFYNEYLHSRLEVHRKVFDLIAEKTKCKPTEGQLSGIGFSSTKHESVIVKVQQGKKQRLFNVKTGA